MIRFCSSGSSVVQSSSFGVYGVGSREICKHMHASPPYLNACPFSAPAVSLLCLCFGVCNTGYGIVGGVATALSPPTNNAPKRILLTPLTLLMGYGSSAPSRLKKAVAGPAVPTSRGTLFWSVQQKKEVAQMTIRCSGCHCVFVRDYSKEVEQSCSKAVSVQTRCPNCNRPLYFIVTPGGVTYLKTHATLLWTYELLFGVRGA